MVWPCLKVFWFGGDNPTGHCEGRGKRRQTERGVGGQCRGVGGHGLCRLSWGGWGRVRVGGGLLRIHLWCPDDLPRLWDRIDRNNI